MTWGMLIVLVVRLLVPLSIFRWPLWGAIASLLADALDVVFLTLVGGSHHYHSFDKYPDTYYFAIEAFVAYRLWPGTPRKIISVLFAIRFTGFLLFEITGIRKMLFFFPNIFESFYLFMAIWDRFGRDWYRLTPRWLAFWLLLLGSLRLVQEYFLHWRQSLDNVVALEVIKDIARFAFGDGLPLTVPLLPLAVLAAVMAVRLVRRQFDSLRARALSSSP
ncbi:MAG TPA: hypothetical protein VFB90_00275 [Dehalococcoidia bacterium]|nr:hypothetical protein [Dehalococcoidia bacterium]